MGRAPALVAAGADGLLLRVLGGGPGDTRVWLQALMATGATVLVHARTPGGAALAAELGIGLHLPDRGGNPDQGGDPGDPRIPLTGRSCHELAGLDKAAESCDYALISPVFAPRSKAAGGELMGIGGLAAACAAARLPVLALGGIDASRIAECLRAGAHGVAGIGAFGDIDSVAAMAEELVRSV